MATLKKLSKAPTEREMWGRLQGALNHNDRRAYRIEAVATPGFPDIVWLTENGTHLIELKAGRLRFRALQIRFIKAAHQLGVTVWVIHQPVSHGEMRVHHGIDLVDEPEPAVACDVPEGLDIIKWLEEMTNG